jgi:SAM-dependent methyltransferase
MTATTIDETKLEAFLVHLANEAGAAMNAALMRIGDELGLFRAMGDSQPVSSPELAIRTQTHERYVREWLSAQAAGRIVDYDPITDRFTLPPEHAMALAFEDSPVAQGGVFASVTAALRSEQRVLEAFRTGAGVGWHEHDHGLFHGTERAFGPSYRQSLIAEWIPALEGVEQKLVRGANVADVGCGHGLAPILLAQAYPASQFDGYDVHAPSIDVARRRAAEAGVEDRVRFHVAAADEYPGRDLDLVTFFDSLHDMGDPVGAARHVRETLAPDGTWMVVEPTAPDRLEDNLNALGRLRYAISTMVCTPGSLSQDGRMGLGTQAGPARLSEVIRAGGFGAVRQAAENPINLVIEARP